MPYAFGRVKVARERPRTPRQAHSSLVGTDARGPRRDSRGAPIPMRRSLWRFVLAGAASAPRTSVLEEERAAFKKKTARAVARRHGGSPASSAGAPVERAGSRSQRTHRTHAPVK